MGQIDLGSSGLAIDITCAEMIFDGDRLSAALASMEWSTKTDEELIHLQGLEDPQERTAGQRSHEATVTWVTRQYVRFCELMGGWDVVKDMEFTLVVNASPKNDPKFYSFTFNKFRLLSDSFNLDKSASMNKISCSFLSFEMESVAQ